ncbi:rna pseudouridine synthase [Nannochloropsis oceanica]
MARTSGSSGGGGGGGQRDGGSNNRGANRDAPRRRFNDDDDERRRRRSSSNSKPPRGSNRDSYSGRSTSATAADTNDMRGQGLRKALSALTGLRGDKPSARKGQAGTSRKKSSPSSPSIAPKGSVVSLSPRGATTRLNKMLAHAGVASRRSAEEMIAQGKVSVNGVIVLDVGCKVDPSVDSITVEGKAAPVALRKASEVVWMKVNKPKGTLTSITDSKGRKCLGDLVESAVEKRLLPVGRLDRDTAGLLLMTNDNEAINLLTHPSFGHVKLYKAVVEKGMPSVHVLHQLKRGLVLLEEENGGKEELEGGAVLEVSVRETKSEEIRRAFEQVGHPVKGLTRVAFGSIVLGDMRLGEAKKLSMVEMGRLRGALAAMRKRMSRRRRKALTGLGSEGEEEGRRARKKSKGGGVMGAGGKGGIAGEEGAEEIDPDIEAFWDAVEDEEDQEEDGVWLGDYDEDEDEGGEEESS